MPPRQSSAIKKQSLAALLKFWREHGRFPSVTEIQEKTLFPGLTSRSSISLRFKRLRDDGLIAASPYAASAYATGNLGSHYSPAKMDLPAAIDLYRDAEKTPEETWLVFRPGYITKANEKEFFLLETTRPCHDFLGGTIFLCRRQTKPHGATWIVVQTSVGLSIQLGKKATGCAAVIVEAISKL